MVFYLELKPPILFVSTTGGFEQLLPQPACRTEGRKRGGALPAQVNNHATRKANPNISRPSHGSVGSVG